MPAAIHAQIALQAQRHTGAPQCLRAETPLGDRVGFEDAFIDEFHDALLLHRADATQLIEAEAGLLFDYHAGNDGRLLWCHVQTPSAERGLKFVLAAKVEYAACAASLSAGGNAICNVA